jgi:hypothetical protein
VAVRTGTGWFTNAPMVLTRLRSLNPCPSESTLLRGSVAQRSAGLARQAAMTEHHASIGIGGSPPAEPVQQVR